MIVSGVKNSLDNLTKNLKKKKIKSIPLKVSAPFHCSLMKPASEKMSEKINNTSFNNPLIEIINNVTATAIKDSNLIKNF